MKWIFLSNPWMLGYAKFWIAWSFDFRPFACLHTPWVHILIGRWQDRLYSERYGHIWCRRLWPFPLRLTIRRLT